MKRGIFSLLFLALLVSSVSGEYYPYDYPQYNQPPSWGYGGIGGFDFNSIYERYSLFIDAIIFGFIFFGLGSLVFGQKVGFTPLYIGLGLFLTGSLLLFESRSNPQIRLLDLAGPWAVTLFVIIVAFSVYIIVKNLIENNLIAGVVAFLSALWLFGQLSSYMNLPFGVFNFFSSFFNTDVFWIIAGVVALIIAYNLIKKGKLKATP